MQFMVFEGSAGRGGGGGRAPTEVAPGWWRKEIRKVIVRLAAAGFYPAVLPDFSLFS